MGWNLSWPQGYLKASFDPGCHREYKKIIKIFSTRNKASS